MQSHPHMHAHTRSHTLTIILQATIEEDRALTARMRATGSLNPSSFDGLDAGSDANIARFEERAARKKTKLAEAEARKLRLRHERSLRDVKDKETFEACMQKARLMDR